MVSRVRTVAFQGIEAVPVDVQVQIAPGSSSIHHRRPAGQGGEGEPRTGTRRAVRLGPVAAAQADHRQPRARRPAQGGQPLRPADRAGADGGDRRHPGDALAGYIALGELALDGTIAPVAGVLPAAIAAQCRELGHHLSRTVSGPEAAWAGEEIDIIAPRSLIALVNHLARHQLAARPAAEAAVRAGAACPTSAKSGARRWRAARSKSPRPAATTC